MRIRVAVAAWWGLSAALLCGTAGYAQQAGERIVVTAEQTPLRTQTQSLASIPKGSMLTVEQVRDGWLWVTYVKGANKTKGWISQRDVVALDKAIEFIENELRRSPQAEFYNIRGMIRFEHGQIDLALADYNESLRLDPNRSHVWNNRGNVQRAKGAFNQAIGDFNQAVRLDPDDPLAYKNRGNVWSDKGAFDKALLDYSEAIRLSPNDADAFNNRGSMSMLQKDYDRAIADWNEAVRLDPKATGAYNNLAWLLATCPDEKHRNAQRAVEMATRACELGGWRNAGHIDTLATAYAQLGDYESAVKWQTRALELAPEPKKAGYEQTLELYKSAQADRQELRK